MARQGKSRFWRLCRIYFRRFRITVLLITLALLVAAVYLNQIGLPGFVKRPLLGKLRESGVDLEFSRLRLRWYRGIVAENVRFGQADEPAMPRLSAREVEININKPALLRLRLQVDALSLHHGNLEWPIAETNAPARALKVEDIEARLRLLPSDQWALDGFRARFAGGLFILSGTVTNASAIREWKFPSGPRTGRVVRWPERLRQLGHTLERISFSTPPELRLMVEGDARDVQSFIARLSINAADADTPWGRATNVVVTANLFPGAGRELSHAEVELQAEDARTPWADTAQLEFQLHLVTVAGQTNLVDADLSVRAAQAETKWASVSNAQFTAHWTHALTNAVPRSGQGEFRAALATTRWAVARDLRFAGALSAATRPPPPDPAWAWWTNLSPHQLDWECEAADVRTEKLDADRVFCAGRWDSPTLAVTNLHAELRGGALDATVQLDVATREATFTVASGFDVQKISPFLTKQAGQWLARYSWTEPPRAQGSGAVTLPAWTDRQPDWRGEVLPTLRLAGEFAVTNGSYLGVPADWVRSHLTFTNRVWRLPDLEAARPEGRLRLEHMADDKTQEFYFHLHSTVDVRAVRPLLGANVQQGLDYVTFSQPPEIDAEIWGRWHDYESTGFRGRVAMTNFSVREQTADSVVAELRYTNHVLEAFEPRLWRGGTQTLSAAGIKADFNTQRIHFTNGFSTTDPMAVVRAIGPKIAAVIEPYRFREPPVARVEGYAPLKNEHDADLHFVVDGGPFEWLKFKVPQIAGDVHWLGDTLVLTNVRSAFYWGEIAGHAGFDFGSDRPGADFNFFVNATNVHLQMLAADLSTHTNRLEGRLSGVLNVTSANSVDAGSWQGRGRVQLQDGVIWAIPIFGVLSKPLDSVVPGLGSSRVSEGSAKFIITNSVIFSDDLEMRSPAVRLQYGGTVRFDGRVDTRVKAEPLRDVWVIGPLVNVALWPVAKILEYRITGTLSDPKTEPVHIPKLLLMPLHPFQTLGDFFNSGSSRTNSPPVFKEPE